MELGGGSWSAHPAAVGPGNGNGGGIPQFLQKSKPGAPAAAAAAAAARGMEFVGGGEPGAGAEEEEGGLLGGGELGLEVLPGAELVPSANPEEVSLGSFEREEAEEAAEAAVAEARAALAALPALRARPVPAGVVPGFGAFVWDAAGAVQVRPKRRCEGGRLPPRPAPLEGGSSRRRAASASSRVARCSSSTRASIRAFSAAIVSKKAWSLLFPRLLASASSASFSWARSASSFGSRSPGSASFATAPRLGMPRFVLDRLRARAATIDGLRRRSEGRCSRSSSSRRRREASASRSPSADAADADARSPARRTDDNGGGGMNDGGGSCGGRGGWGTGRWGACRRSSSRTRRTACR